MHWHLETRATPHARVGETAGGLLAFRMAPEAMLAPEAPLGAPMTLALGSLI
jgi:hypothetical protein